MPQDHIVLKKLPPSACPAGDELTEDEARAVRRIQRLRDTQDVSAVVRTWIGCAPNETARMRRSLAASRLGLEQLRNEHWEQA